SSSLMAQRGSSATRTLAQQTSWAHPDLQGVWDFSNEETPLERPPQFKDRTELTDAEVAQRHQRALDERLRLDTFDQAQRDADKKNLRAYNQGWIDAPRITNRQS